MRKHFLYAAVGACLGLAFAGSSAHARRLLGWMGVDTPGEDACWNKDGSRLEVNAPQCPNDRYFSIGLPFDSNPTSVNPTWVQGTLCPAGNICFGDICGRAATFDVNGNLFRVHPNFTCGVGQKNLGALAVPSGGTALLNVEFESPQGLNDKYISNVSYTP